MKKIIFSFLLLCSAAFLNAQTDSSSVNSKSSTIQIGAHTITAKTTVEQLIKALGTPSRIEKIAGKDRHYIYDALGLAFDCRSGSVEAVTFTFHYDNDKKVAIDAVKNGLKIDNFTISDATTTDQIKANTNIKNIMCLGELMCMSDPSQPGAALVIGYSKDKKITQISIGLK
ncbi:MAG: hypothetical protein PSX81_09335 [bacterium]|nr:hypothetical protein [bacterium]